LLRCVGTLLVSFRPLRHSRIFSLYDGRRDFRAHKDHARRGNGIPIAIDCNPHATYFYLHCGGIRGSRPSPSIARHSNCRLCKLYASGPKAGTGAYPTPFHTITHRSPESVGFVMGRATHLWVRVRSGALNFAPQGRCYPTLRDAGFQATKESSSRREVLMLPSGSQ
jgi:hypothetical protein